MYLTFSAVHKAFNTPIEITLYDLLLRGIKPYNWIEGAETATLRALYYKKNLALIITHRDGMK